MWVYIYIHVGIYIYVLLYICIYKPRVFQRLSKDVTRLLNRASGSSLRHLDPNLAGCEGRPKGSQVRPVRCSEPPKNPGLSQVLDTWEGKHW